MEQDRFAYDTYLVRKKVFKIFGEAFHIYGPDEQVVLFSKLKAFKLKEDIRLYTGEDMTEEVLSIQARQIIDFAAAYDVWDPVAQEKVGALKRRGFKSMFRDEWILMDQHDAEIGVIKEESTSLALLRRFVDLASLIFPQSYYVDVAGQRVCLYKRRFNPFIMKLTVDFTSDTELMLDRRLGLAGAVLLCAIEGRQN